MKDRYKLYAWLATVAAGLLVGAYGVVRLMTEGTVVLGIDSQLPWGILISTYVFLVLVSTGICIGVTPLATVFGINEYETLVKRGLLLSLATLAAGGAVILVSLGRTFRAVPVMLLSPNPSSVMWWMIVLYGVYGAALAGEFYLIERRGTSLRSVAVLALIAPIFAGSALGAIFGLAETRPYYGGIYGPVYFVISAVLSGIAAVSLVTGIEHAASGKSLSTRLEGLLTGYLRKSLALTLGVMVFLMAWKAVRGVTATGYEAGRAYEYMLFGPHAWWVWGVVVLAGTVVPLFLTVYPGTRTVRGVLTASVLVLVGLFASRVEYVVGGQVVSLSPNDPGLGGPVLSYTPTGVEAAVAVLGFAVAALLYTAGSLAFDLDETAHATEKRVEDEAADVTAVGGDSD